MNIEWGANINYQLKKKIRVGVGLSYKTYNYKMGVLFDTWDDLNVFGDRVADKYENTLRIKAMGFRGIIDFYLTEKYKTRLAIILEFNKPLSYDFTNPVIAEGGYGDVDYRFLETTSQNKLNIDHYITPEIHFSTEIVHNIAVSYGMKLRFWGNEDLYTLQVAENSRPNEPLFDYRIDSRNLAFFVGLNYTFQLPKVRKPKSE